MLKRVEHLGACHQRRGWVDLATSRSRGSLGVWNRFWKCLWSHRFIHRHMSPQRSWVLSNCFTCYLCLACQVRSLASACETNSSRTLSLRSLDWRQGLYQPIARALALSCDMSQLVVKTLALVLPPSHSDPEELELRFESCRSSSQKSFHCSPQNHHGSAM